MALWELPWYPPDMGVSRLGRKGKIAGVERCLSAQVDWAAYTTLGVLGLDEIALKKGHRDFVVIVTARLSTGRVVILGVLPDRLKKTVAAFLRSIPEPLRQTIHTVCSDMYEGYIEAVREKLKTAVLKRRCYGICNVKHLFQRIYLDLEGYSLFA